MTETLGKLGIDLWGVVLYLVNFGVLFFLLKRFLLKPLMAAVDKRRETIRENVAEAERLRSAFQEEAGRMRKESEDQLRSLQERYESVTAVAKKDAEQLLADAERKRTAMLAETAERVESMKASAIADAEKEIVARMERVIKAVLRDDVPNTVVRKSVEDGWKELA